MLFIFNSGKRHLCGIINFILLKIEETGQRHCTLGVYISSLMRKELENSDKKSDIYNLYRCLKIRYNNLNLIIIFQVRFSLFHFHPQIWGKEFGTSSQSCINIQTGQDKQYICKLNF